MSRSILSVRSVHVALFVTAAALITPTVASAQSGRWVGTVSTLRSAGGSVDITIEPRGDKQSRVRLTVRNVNRDMRIAWDIVAGQCRDNGAPIAPQAAFTQLQSQMDGGGTAAANVPKLASGQPYYVRVFDPQLSPTDDNVWGCANLAEKP
jgi:hypothetical protein